MPARSNARKFRVYRRHGRIPIPLIRIATAFILTFFIGVAALNARGPKTAYQKGKELMDEDPAEAEAWLSIAFKDVANSKIRRAARYDLFYLRLRHGRTAEALPLASTKTMHRRLRIAVADGLGISGRSAGQIIAYLSSACQTKKVSEKLRVYLESDVRSIREIDFAVRTGRACGVRDFAAMIPVGKLAEGGRRQINRELYRLREAIYEPDLDATIAALSKLREASSDAIEGEKSLQLQLLLLEARIAARQEDFTVLTERCAEIRKLQAKGSSARSCIFLETYGHMHRGQAQQAWKLIGKVRLGAYETDNRLLVLVTAVAAKKRPRNELLRWLRRKSASDLAPMLRELAKSYASAEVAK
jgi:hypothetical protein